MSMYTLSSVAFWGEASAPYTVKSGSSFPWPVSSSYLTESRTILATPAEVAVLLRRVSVMMERFLAKSGEPAMAVAFAWYGGLQYGLITKGHGIRSSCHGSKTPSVTL